MISSARKNELLAHAEEVFAKVQELQRLGLICDDGDFVPSVHYPPSRSMNPVIWINTWEAIRSLKTEKWMYMSTSLSVYNIVHFAIIPG